MASWNINISGKSIRQETVRKIAEALSDKYGEDAQIIVTDNNPPESRADRLQAAMDLVEDAKSEVESLRDELQEWFDNLPESFQQGQKGEDLEEAISGLSDLYDNLENCDGSNVAFPVMY
jgi:uncharacterized protein (DUF1697 family)